jgi:hypothetical protein
VGVEAGVFLVCALACDEAVAAVTEALIGFGCFFGEPPSVTVGPTDCERPTEIDVEVDLKSFFFQSFCKLHFRGKQLFFQF